METKRVVLGCVVQGDIRRGTDLVLSFMTNYFDVVILSTWEEEEDLILKSDKYDVVRSVKPIEPGLSHRNYQRLSTAAGIKRAKEMKCTHVLKWRTDMIPTGMELQKLIAYSEYKIEKGFDSRLVTCAYRNLSCSRDWFSSIPDLFAFGHISIMELLWSDDNFDYSKLRNVPDQMLKDEGDLWIEDDLDGGIWCAESELYSHFKDRLQKQTGAILTHEQIAKKYMTLIDHKELQIIWFGKTSGFRPIYQAREHPWWSVATWKGKRNVVLANFAYELTGLASRIISKLSTLLTFPELLRQKKYLYNLTNNESHSKKINI